MSRKRGVGGSYTKIQLEDGTLVEPDAPECPWVCFNEECQSCACQCRCPVPNRRDK